MTLQAEANTALEMVRLGYACDDPTDERRCLHFRVGFDSLDGAQAAVRAIGSYNAFDGDEVAEALAKLPTSTMGHKIDVGREGSPAIYVRWLRSEQQIDAVNILREAGADEVDVVRGDVRAWWD